jgi:hypothetical protein
MYLKYIILLEYVIVTFFINCLFITIPLSVFSQNEYALLIGINHYAPPENYVPSTNIGRLDFKNLDGCINDVNAIYSVITSRFQFSAPNIDTLLDNRATRENILKAMDALFEKCKSGDIALIYYSGHGSRVRNSLSANKADKYDETVVPSDTWKEGIRDIRDKELSKRFNRFLDKKIKLTVIFDCCNSGSISRGPNLVRGKLRYVAEENWDAKDAYLPQVPEKRVGNNFLSLFATQSDKSAQEIIIQEDSASYTYQGAFTHALIEALQQEPENISVADLFIAARGILKNYGLDQEPVIGGSEERKNENLFGTAKGKMNNFSTIAVSDVMNKKVILEGGWALGLHKGNELAYINNDTLYQLKVDEVVGVSKCIASVVKGKTDGIKRGYLFKITNWVSPDVPLINVYIPKSDFSNDDVSKILSVASQLKKTKKFVWLENIRNSSPYVSVFYSQNKSFIKIDTSIAKELKTITVKSVSDLCKIDSSLYFELPISEENADAIRSQLALNFNIRIVDSINLANYTLFGKLGRNNAPAYGFRKMEVSAEDTLESMPISTNCYEIQNNKKELLADSLAKIAQKLSRLRAWLSIIKTPDGSSKSFPFRLQIYNLDKEMIEKESYKIGDSVTFSIVIDSGFYYKKVLPSFVYVFALDQSGTMQLLFPDDETGNSENKLPVYNNGQMKREYTINKSGRIPLPTGTDNYFILATNEVIPNPDRIFNQQGVNSNVISRGISENDYLKNPLYQLLDVGNVDSTIKGSFRDGRLPSKLPSSWTLKKFSYKCTY